MALLPSNNEGRPYVGLGSADWARLVSQQWQFVYVALGNYYAILNVALGSNRNTITVNNSRLELTGENWDQQANQRFIIQPVAAQPGTYAIINIATNKPLSYNPNPASIMMGAYNDWDNDIKQRFIISEIQS